MDLSKNEIEEVLNFVEKMGDLVDLVKRMDNSSGFVNTFTQALEISNKTNVNSIRQLLLSKTR